MVGRRGLQVLTGSGTSVHRFLDDGSAIIAATGSNKTNFGLIVSGSTKLGRQTNNVKQSKQCQTRFNHDFQI